MKKDKHLASIFIYLLLFFSVVFIIHQFVFPGLLDSANFLYWDAAHYYNIKNAGYSGAGLAFFPLFPMLWKLLSFDIHGIVLFNIAVFAISFYLLIRSLNTSVWETLLYSSIPSFIFFYLPYSESIFFASSLILLAGLKQKRSNLLLLGLFLCTLTRPAFMVFIPGIFITEYLSNVRGRTLVLNLLKYVLVISAALLIVGIIQNYYTGEWFKFFSAQKHWGTELQIPRLPLTSWAGGLIVRLDAAAMLFGLISAIIISALVFNIKRIKNINIPAETIFSLCYLAGITFSLLIFRGGTINSLNRYVFAVPFIIVALNFFFKSSVKLKTSSLVYGFILIFVFFLLFGSYGHIQSVLKFSLLSSYLLLILGIKSMNLNLSRLSIYLVIGLNVFFQLYFYIRFLQGAWVG